METTDLDEKLRAHGYRVTSPRRRVWQALHRAGSHLTADEVAAQVEGEVDPASVYRTLGLFEELGIARVSRFPDSDAGRWEPAHPDEHFHLVCTACGIVDHHIGTLVASIREHLDTGHGFEASNIDLTVSGRCRDCRARPAARGDTTTT